MILTRPLDAAQGFASQMRAAGFAGEIILSPLFEIIPVDVIVPHRGQQDVVFTSQNGVRFGGQGRGRAWCVGDATAAAATAQGWDAISAGGDSDALIARILADAPSGALVHFRGRQTRGDVAHRLTEAGITTTDHVVYEQRACALTRQALKVLGQSDPVIIPLFSPNSAAEFVANGPFKAALHLVAISDAVADPLQVLPAEVLVICAQPDGQSMADAVFSQVGAACRIEGYRGRT